ncbi:ATP-binding protein [Muricoccus aerilatus]|uniref:ATP-binding protein n=1 Tax=Muricoccus aerilatus TaxID=452982 RepID=UPI000693D66D|nr:ATP-binding protein [Roseomonas aerilata]
MQGPESDIAAMRHEMPPAVEAVPALLDQLEAFAEASALSPRNAQHLVLVAEELAANVAMHATGATRLLVEVRREGPALHLLVEDDGPAFDPLSAAAPDLESGVEERDLGGLGVHFLRTLARNVSYERRGGLNRVTALLDAG